MTTAKPSNGSPRASVEWNPALSKLQQQLASADLDDGDRISVIVEAPKPSLRPLPRALVAVLRLLPPWGRVVVLTAAISLAATGYALDWW